MSNLKLSLNTIPHNALTITNDVDEKEDFPLINSFDCKRHSLFRTSSTDTTLTLVYDLGTGREQTADHFILARADLLQEDSVTEVRLRHSPDNSVWTTVFDETSFDSEDLVGPHSKDWINTFTETASRRYWEVRLTAGSASNFTVSKIIFGSFMSFSYDVDSYNSRYNLRNNAFIAPDGSAYFIGTYQNTYEYTLNFKGVTDAEFLTLETQLLEPTLGDFFIYSASEDNLTDGNSLVHCNVIDFRGGKVWTDWNEVELTVGEAIG